MDWKLQLVALLVADQDRSKAFYLDQAGFDLLVERGADASEIFHFEDGAPAPGPDPERRDYGSFLTFSDPDGNSWMVQEVRPAG
jgi:catechol 2,3-dioxygenase-like lactoylglutathione lyase family enzyme